GPATRRFAAPAPEGRQSVGLQDPPTFIDGSRFRRPVRGQTPLMRQAERAAQNESTFRGANETLEERAEEIVGDRRPTPYLCECEDERCTQVILLTRGQYEAIRANSRTFVLAVGHESPADRVLKEGASVHDGREDGRGGRARRGAGSSVLTPSRLPIAECTLELCGATVLFPFAAG